MKNIIFTLAVCAALSGCAKPVSNQSIPPTNYAVYQSMPLDPVESGIQGSLQILQDRRVTPEYRKTWGMSNGPEARSLLVNSPTSPPAGILRVNPSNDAFKYFRLEDGRFRVVAIDGHTIYEEALDAPLGKIKREFLYGTKFPTYFVTVDLGVGMGSYAGPATTLVEIKNGKVQHLPIALMDSPKNAWRIVPALNGQGKEIQQIQCHFYDKSPPDKDEFVVVYTTYRFKGDKWDRLSKEKVGFWENDEGWPERSEFP